LQKLETEIERLYIINLSYANYSIIAVNNIITEAPPIVKWMVGKSIDEVEKWVKSKKGTMNERRS
jgi:hypothetical protein